MNGSFDLEDLAVTIRLPGAVAYMKRHGWATTRDEQGRQIWFEGSRDDEGNPIRLYLPASDGFADFPLRLEELIAALAVIEERPAIEIVREMEAASTVRVVDTVEQLLREFAQNQPDYPAEDATRLIEDLQPLLDNAELEINQELQDHVGVTLRQLALICAQLGARLPGGRPARQLIWQLCENLLGQIGLSVSWPSQEVDELYSCAVLAEADAPDMLYEWLIEHTAVPHDASRDEPRERIQREKQ